MISSKWYSALIKRKIMHSIVPPSGHNPGSIQSTVAFGDLKVVKKFQTEIIKVTICLKDIFVKTYQHYRYDLSKINTFRFN